MRWSDHGKSVHLSLVPGSTNQAANEPTITTVSVDSLKQSQDNPNINREDVEVARESGVEDRASNGTGSKNQDFSGIGIFSCKTKRYSVLNDNLMITNITPE